MERKTPVVASSGTKIDYTDFQLIEFVKSGNQKRDYYLLWQDSEYWGDFKVLYVGKKEEIIRYLWDEHKITLSLHWLRTSIRTKRYWKMDGGCFEIHPMLTDKENLIFEEKLKNKKSKL